MWWCRATLLLSLLALGPAGCGFSPLYAKGGGTEPSSPVGEALATIRIDPIKDRLGQQLRNALVQRLSPRGEPGDYRFTLKITLTESTTDLGYRRDALATLGRMDLQGSFSLIGDDVGVGSGNAKTSVYFDYLGPRYASIAVERDAEERAVTQLADQIRSQVATAIAHYRANPHDRRYKPVNSDGGLTPLAPVERR